MPGAEKTAVHCKGITKTYGKGPGEVVALRGVDLDVRQGELLMLVGPSGSGKTTLISIIGAMLSQDSGRCEVFDHDLQRMDESEKLKFRGTSIGFVFQVFNLLPALTITENVSVPLLINGVSRKEAERKAVRALELVGLGKRVNALPAQLSGGQQQRVAIARALVHSPRLVICDEPTSNLDHKTGQEMMGLLRDVGGSPERALIVVTHNTRILGFADRIAHMDDGRITDIVTGQKQETAQ